MANLLVRIAYEGTAYCGFQIQQSGETVESVLKRALERLHRKSVVFHAAGRTDAGVHATGQYINVHTDAPFRDRFHRALNAHLPDDVRALSFRPVSPEFHARYSALRRYYTYRCYVGEVMPPQHRNFSVLLREVGNLDAMNEDAARLAGEHDFRSFATVDAEVKNTVRRVFNASFSFEEPFLVFRISANAFLRKMVRSIVGTLLERQKLRLRGKKLTTDLRELLEGPRRDLAGPTAASKALYLSEVEFDE